MRTFLAITILIVEHHFHIDHSDIQGIYALAFLVCIIQDIKELAKATS